MFFFRFLWNSIEIGMMKWKPSMRQKNQNLWTGLHVSLKTWNELRVSTNSAVNNTEVVLLWSQNMYGYLETKEVLKKTAPVDA